MVHGCGYFKKTVIDRLRKEHPDVFAKSISHTTRAPRTGEVNGKHYHFTTREQILKDFDAGLFIERAEIHGNIYGTTIKAVQDVAAQGKICVLDIDVQGCDSVKAAGLNPFCIFLLPPSTDELRRRLANRGTETPEQIETRMHTAEKELAWKDRENFWNHLITNDNFEECYDKILKTVEETYHITLLNKTSSL
jgi:guanylate kinase